MSSYEIHILSHLWAKEVIQNAAKQKGHATLNNEDYKEGTVNQQIFVSYLSS